MNTAVEFMGLYLKNPVMVAAGPWTRNGEQIRRAFEAGAGAVVTETILHEIRPNVRPRLATTPGGGVQNIRLYSEIELEEWEDEIAIAKKGGGIVIANVMAYTPSEMAYIASRMEKFGADAIELGLASPHGEGIEVLTADPQKIFSIIQQVSSTVKIPVMVKLSPSVTNLAKVARAVEKSGATAISAIDTIRCILGVNIHSGMPLLPTYGGYSGEPIRPIGLATVATVAQSVKLPVCGIGGIKSYEHVLEYMMLGAGAVQVGTAVMLNGYGQITGIVKDLEEWMNREGISSLEEIKGRALKHLKSFEEIKARQLVSQPVGRCHRADCSDCQISCLYDAISREGEKITVNEALCGGCGICVTRCPEGVFRMGQAGR